MSQQNLESFKRAVAAWNRGDADAMLKEFDPELEWHGVFGVMFGGEVSVCRGRDELREYLRDVDEGFAERHVDYGEIRELGNRILAIGGVKARGRKSRVEIDSPYGILVEFRDGRVHRVRDYFDPAKALEAAGLSE